MESASARLVMTQKAASLRKKEGHEKDTHQFPFYRLEKWVCHDLHEARARFAIAAQSVHGVLVQEAFEDGGRFHAK